jgi:hypothetical protein
MGAWHHPNPNHEPTNETKVMTNLNLVDTSGVRLIGWRREAYEAHVKQ